MASFNGSVSEESRSRATLEETSRTRNQSGQCPPMTLSFGKIKIQAGNGTSVGTVITLECPSNHRPDGQISCIQENNNTRWSGGVLQCKPLPQYENDAFRPRNVGHGFHLAVLLSIISSAIIIFMSIVFITSCLLSRVKKEESRRMERRRRKEDEAYWQNMDQQEMREAFYSHKTGNNNNNNNNNKTQQRQAAPNVQTLTFKHQQAASRCHQQGYHLIVQPSQPLHEAMPPNAYRNTHTSFVLQTQLLPAQPSTRYNPTLEQPSWIRPIPTPAVPPDGAVSGGRGHSLKDPFWQNQHSPDPKSPPIWVISV
ncbi:uncharacterized protein LOC103034958 [Astyanax mexicanus]|uniref:Uncharacterized LOC103034958 n=1 Tax=Astyanax mexicanus TaxID=7994 RepID=A0A3B1KKJ9_ASTMX|nr:uncharacterized protein LOC103034958 [Astyanax mexicanus]